MKARRLHSWDVTPAEARSIQQRLRGRVEPFTRFGRVQGKRDDRLPRVRHIAGADCAFDTAGRRAIACVVLYRFPKMQELERVTAIRPLRFPYVPGLLSFREAPVLLAAFGKLRRAPDLIFIDGHGIAHPRRFGIACHVGVLLNCPAIGCAKSRLIGTHAEPGRAAGQWSPLDYKGEIIGAVLRTRAGVRPVYVSTGHRISLESAIRWTLNVCDGYRIPRPTRDADRFVSAAKMMRRHL